jgi:competence ComEA-like helix-hairpin-helix protein
MFKQSMHSQEAVANQKNTKGPQVQFRNAFAFLFLSLLLVSSGAQAADSTQPLDLNRATAEQLVRLPGIGEAKAAAILAIRAERGGFRSLDELENVRGIGPKLAAKLRPLLKVANASRKRDAGQNGKTARN